MIEDATLFKSYNCDGAVETFNIVVDYLKDASNIKIYYVVIATGVQYLLVKDTNYTVDIINDTITTITGSITGLGSTSSPYASGIKLNILLDVPYTQLLDIVSNADYNPESLEAAYDKNTLLAKQIKEVLDRTLQLQEGDAGNTMVLPPLVDLINGVLGFDETGQPIAHPGFIPRAYSPTYSYQTNDIIQYDGLFYIALQTALGQTPGTAPTYWALYNLQNINAWDNTTTYALDAVVAHLGFLYISLQAANVGNTPASSPAYWKVWQNAAGIPITDTGNYYTGSEVETALQEIGALRTAIPTTITEDTKQTLASIITVSSANNPKIAAMTDTLMAYFDDGNERLYAFSFTPTTGFAIVGNYFTTTGSTDSTIVALSATSIALYTVGTATLSKYDWDGTDWTLDGSALTITGSPTSPIMAALSDTDVAFYDDTNDELRRYNWNGSTWVLVGAALALVGSNGALCATGESEVVFIDETGTTLRTYRWTQEASPTWAIQSTSAAIGTLANPSMVALSKNIIALINDNGGLNIRLFKRAGNSVNWNQLSTYHLIALPGFDAGITAVAGYIIATMDTTDDIRSFKLDYTPEDIPPNPSF